MKQHRFDELVGHLYDAAMEPSRWGAALQAIVDHFDGSRFAFLLPYGRTNAGVTEFRCNEAAPEALKRACLSLADAVDRGVSIMTDGHIAQCLTIASFVDGTAIDRFETKHGLGDTLGVRLRTTAQSGILFGLCRDSDAPTLPVADSGGLETICSHLERALAIADRLRFREPEPKIDETASLFQAVDLLNVGVALIENTTRTVVASNRAFREFLERKDGLSLDGSRVGAKNRAESNDLDRLISLALSPRLGAKARPVGGRVQRTSTQSPYLLLVSPLSSPTGQPRTLVLVSDPDGAGSTIDPDQIVQTFGLTRAEAEIAAGLGRGLRVEQIAQSRSVSPDTVRAQVKSALQKAGVNRQGQLLQLISSLPRLHPQPRA